LQGMFLIVERGFDDYSVRRIETLQVDGDLL
jgi:hypothetical protein